MNETSENDKKHKFGTIFAPFDPVLGLKNIFLSFISTSSYALFQAIIIYSLR